MSIFGEDAGLVAHGDAGETVGQQQFCDGNPGAPGAVYHHKTILLFLSRHFQGVDDACQHHYGRAVLVVVEDRDVQGGFQAFFDLKASGSADVFQVDAAVGRGKPGDGFDDLLHILRVQADGHCVDAAEFLEQYGFSLHDGEGGVGADVAQAQYGASVGDYGHGVGFHGVYVGSFPVLGDGPAGFSHPGGICDRQVFT